MDCSTPGLSVSPSPGVCPSSCPFIGDALQPSHPLMPSSPLAFNLSQHQGLFQCVCFLHQMSKVLELQLQHQSFWWIFRVDFLYDWLIWSPCSPRDSQESSLAPQFESIDSLALSLPYGPTHTPVHDYWERGFLRWTDQSLLECSEKDPVRRGKLISQH